MDLRGASKRLKKISKHFGLGVNCSQSSEELLKNFLILGHHNLWGFMHATEGSAITNAHHFVSFIFNKHI